MTDKPHLIEVAFPLKQTSIDSVHEKNVRHGHISTLHIWPARRPLAACRAALIATLLPDPGNKKERAEILEKLGGIIVDKTKKKKLPGGKIEETYTQEAEGIIPGGAYDLWREDEESRRVSDLVGAFAQRPNLPKMLNSKSILNTLLNGCAEGIFVLRMMRSDRTFRTFWRSRPDEVALKDPSLEAVLPEFATLSEFPVTLLSPEVLPQLWTSNNSLTLRQIYV